MVANTRAGSRRKTVVKLSKEIVRAQREGDWPDTVPVHHIPALITELACLQQRLAARLLGEQSADEGDLSGDTLLDVKVAAERLGISADWLYRRSRKLPFTVRLGHRLRFSAQGIDLYIKQRHGR